MKILRIELQNNSFFGNAIFDFCSENDKPYDNIVIAGENGSGKTQLLNLIYDFSLMNIDEKVSESEIRTFYIYLNKDEVDRYKKKLTNSIMDNPTGNFKIKIDGSKTSWDKINIQYESNNENTIIWKKSSHPSSRENKDAFKTVFSAAEVSYIPKTSSNVTSKEIDEDFTSSIKSNDSLATDIQQLLIDVKTNDANDLDEWVEKNPDKIPSSAIKNKRISRFKNAFSYVFDNMNFEKIKTENNRKIVVFQKNGREIDIASLSSGEKQIVFRGAFLLQHQQAAIGYPILIDEPEISLHPRWQKKIFDYYRKLCMARNNVQTSQMLIATHSQYVLESALNNSSNTVVFLMKNNGDYFSINKLKQPFVLPVLTSAELMYEAFNIVSRDYHNELYGYLQKVFRVTSIAQMDKVIVANDSFDKNKHSKKSTYRNTEYNAKTTYIRNIIDHPDYKNTFSEGDLAESIQLLRKICLEKSKDEKKL